MSDVSSAVSEQIIAAEHLLVDYDGLLVNSEDLYFQTWCAVLTQEGQAICKDFHKGRHEVEVYKKIKPFLLRSMTLEEVSAYRRSLFDDLVQEGRLSLIGGIATLLQTLSSLAPMSIVSNSELNIVNHGLKAAGIDAYFARKYCYHKGVRRKPAPDLYNAAMVDLGLDQHAVVAFEDSQSGLDAALTAGLLVVCISDDKNVVPFCTEQGIALYRAAIELANDIKASLTEV